MSFNTEPFVIVQTGVVPVSGNTPPATVVVTIWPSISSTASSTSSTASLTSSTPIQNEANREAPALSSNGKLALEIVLPLGGILFIVGIRLGLQALHKRRAKRNKKEAGISAEDEEQGLDKKTEEEQNNVAELDGREIMGELGMPANTAEMEHPPVELP